MTADRPEQNDQLTALRLAVAEERARCYSICSGKIPIPDVFGVDPEYRPMYYKSRYDALSYVLDLTSAAQRRAPEIMDLLND